MVNANYNTKKEINSYRKNYINFIFICILILYFTGIYTGCLFAFKNDNNIDFLSEVIIHYKVSEGGYSRNFAMSGWFVIRDTLYIFIMYILRNARMIKGTAVCIPFIYAIQNACFYCTHIVNKSPAVNILFSLLKDTAVCFLIIMFCCITVIDIIADRKNKNRYIKKTILYICGVLIIYLIYFIVWVFI